MRKLLFIFLLLAGSSFALNTGLNSPASSAQESSPTTSWTNIDSVFASDNQRTAYAGTTEDSLYITNFTMGVPTSATITAIIVTSEGFGAGSQAPRRRFMISLTRNGTVIVGETVTFEHQQTTDNVITHSGTTDSLWNTTWTEAQVNATTFGLVLWKQGNKTDLLSADHFQINVHYTEAGGARATVISTGVID